MRSHWVLLIVCLIFMPVGLLALGLSFGVAFAIAITVRRLGGVSIGEGMFFSIMLVTLGPLVYIGLRLVRPDRLIDRLLRR